MQVEPLGGLQDPFSALVHLGGALVFVGLAVPLLRRARGDRTRLALLGVYAFACVLLLSMSGVYHALAEGSTARAVLNRLDRAAIFVLIAGTHTPVQGLFFRGVARWGVLLALWLVAALGITLFVLFHTALPDGLATGTYLVLGWLAGISGLIVWRRIGTARIAPLVLGGVAYTLGALLLALDGPTLVAGHVGAHELWHLAVLLGMGLHWTFLFQNARAPLVVSAPA